MHKSQQLYAQRERRSFMAELAEERTRCVVDTVAKSVGSGRKKRKRDRVDSRQYKRLENRVKKMDSHFSNAQIDLNDILITTKKISNKKDKLLKLDNT